MVAVRFAQRAQAVLHGSKATPRTAHSVKEELKGKTAKFEALKTRAPAILRVHEEIAKSGNMSRGVYRVETADGQKHVLKIANVGAADDRFEVPLRNGATETHPYDLPRSVLLQNVLADHGVAPRVHGIYPVSKLGALVPQLRAVNPTLSRAELMRGPWVGILMDEVAAPWNVMTEPAPVGFRFTVPKEAVREKLNQVDTALRRLHIFELNQQVVVTQTGDVKLIDLEFTTFVEKGVPARLESAAETYGTMLSKLKAAVPFGQKRVGSKLVADAGEQHLLRQLAELAKRGKGAAAIAAELNQRFPRSCRGRKWTSADVERVAAPK